MAAHAKRSREKARVVSFNCVLRDRFGHVISSSFNNEVVVVSGADKKLRRQAAATDGLVRGLGGVRKGEKRRVSVMANEAYGFYDRDLVLEVPRRKFPEDGNLQVGSNVLAEYGDGRPRLYRIVAVSRTHVTLDGNHPLAGQDLVFDIEAVDVRDATPAEMAEVGGEPTGEERPDGKLNRPDLHARGRFGYLH